MHIALKITGTTPFLMHNIQGADPDLPLVREQKAITAKHSKMTEDDRRQVERIEWHLGTYVEDGVLVVPTRNIKKALIDSAKITREGQTIVRGLSFGALSIPLKHSGNGDLDAMCKSGGFTSRMGVGIGQKRVMRVRPQFMPWGLEFEAFLFEDAIDFDSFCRIIDRAGVAIGLGDNRTNGYGRFDATVTRL